MRYARLMLAASLIIVSCLASSVDGALKLQEGGALPGDVPIVVEQQAADIFVDSADAKVVQIATELLAGDIEQVTGVKPEVRTEQVAGQDRPVIVIGTLGKSALIDDLVKRGKLDASAIAGKWESYVIATIAEPFSGVAKALVIAGSDRRGTAYGVFDISETIGVSPWGWWADVPPQHRDTLIIAAGMQVQGPPSVKYRGIFINDEDWGLQPWAAKTHEPETGDIGPKTYARVFELLLRLKANYCWPAMHVCTKAFNHYAQNKQVADDYAIVMGSSHCEQMLRNNVDEWDKEKDGEWNPVTNLERIQAYWEQRVQENSGFENIYTVGMRGIHDSNMPGDGTLVEKRMRLEKIIGLQRAMLAKHVNPDPARVPQIFCPYKEVLEIYQAGMQVPDDITIVWPDDNYGYIRQLPDAAERRRRGGNGVYYHISYLGRPHDYLWLDSTSPARIWLEMNVAYALGARQLWVVNVGDIKPNETGMMLFLQMAWDIGRYGSDVQEKFLRGFYEEQFGARYAEAIAAVKDEYYRLCAIRKPEHMGFNRVFAEPKPVQETGWSHDSTGMASQLLKRWSRLAERAEALAAELPAESRAAYFQLVEYPARAGAAMVEKIILAEEARWTGSEELADRAAEAFHRIGKLTEQYNALEGGKWRGIMDYRPRGIPVFDMPPTKPMDGVPSATSEPQATRHVLEIAPAQFKRVLGRDGAGWRVIDGLSPRGAAMAVLPPRDTPTLRSPQDIRDKAPVAEYSFVTQEASDAKVTIEALPTFPFTPAHELLAAVSIDNDDPVIVRFERGNDDENDPVWQKNVLRGQMVGRATLPVPAGSHQLRLWAADPGIVVQRILLKADGLAAPLRVVIIGDSTVRDYPDESPERGWGQYIEERFEPGTVNVVNLAASGRSTKTFIQEGRWAEALKLRPDIVLIQFGHNDSHAPERPESTDAATDYREYLRTYIDEARSIGATPILVTPMVRRSFDDEGRMAEGKPVERQLVRYADAMKAIGAERDVPVIDLHASSWALAEKLGPEASAHLANKDGDITHFNEKGARAIADLIMEDLPKVAPELRKRLKTN